MKTFRTMGLGALCASMILAGCLGDGSSQSTVSTGAPAAGRVAVLLTDAPVAPGTFSHIYLTVTGVYLLAEDDAHTTSQTEFMPIKLFEGEETIDLLNLTNHSKLFALTDVPAGDYEKIRLIVSKLELVKVTGENTTESYFPHLPGNGKIDLNPRGTIHVESNATLIAQIDVDAEKSIHIVQKGNKDEYNFRPVIFVNIVTDAFPGKLVRHSGYVDELNTIAGTLELCDTPLAQRAATDHCLMVTLENSTVFAADGAPALASALAKDHHVTAVGFLGIAPPATSNALVALTALHAEVVEIGGPDSWKVYHGAVGTSPATALDSFTVLPDSATMLTALLQTGTKVFARDGSRLDYTAITKAADVAVDAVPDSADATMLKSSLVVVDTRGLLDHVIGTVKSVDYVTRDLVVNTSSGDVTIHADDDTLVFLIFKTGDVVNNDQVEFGAIQPDDAVTVYGRTQDDGSVEAKVVVIDATL